jgi:hypothetical protein
LNLEANVELNDTSLVSGDEDVGVSSLVWQFLGADEVFLLSSAAGLRKTPSLPVGASDCRQKKSRAINLLDGEGKTPNSNIKGT